MTKPKATKSSQLGADLPQQKSWTLKATEDMPGQTPDQFMAKAAVGGLVGNARSLVEFGQGTFGDLSLTDCAEVLKETAKGLNGGDLSAAVNILAAQAIALNAMFGELSRRSALNMGQYIDAAERYMRLALKAQGQCRATLETLAAIKNPPVVFARQANINNGGQQQVNNGAPQNRQVTDAGATTPHADESLSGPNELLEDCTHGRTQLDARAATATGRAHQDLATVEAGDRAANT